MKSFLLELAERIYRDQPTLDKLTLVFPNRRAILYFRKHLTSFLDKPAFSPEFITIEDFIGQFSSLTIPDKLELVHELYKAYYEVLHEEHPVPEPFDKFYFWGDMLLRDFDEVDKYMVNASQLFRDLSNQKELDASYDFLTPEQLEFLKSFWGNFDEEDITANKRKFLRVWRQLPDIYQAYKNRLGSSGIAYQGMLHRQVADEIENRSVRADRRFIFAGFNALTIAEEKIITSFVAKGNAEIHWDLDDYYLNNNTQEAGKFFRHYQHHAILSKTFSQPAPANFASPKNVRIIGAAQHVGQTRAMAMFLEEELVKNKINPEETLIVLPDEKLLLPVLHGISGSIDKLNVTMGFPLASTPMFNLIEFAVELQANRKDLCFNHRHVVSLLNHPYVLAADPAHANSLRKEIIDKNRITVAPDDLTAGPELYPLIFRLVQEQGIMSYLREIISKIGTMSSVTGLDKEYAFHFLKLINRFELVTGTISASLEEIDAEKRFQSSLKSFIRLFRQLVRSEKIPFSGEPLKGLQVMGVLETRNLDFKNVFILSLNEGALPAAGNKPSYIPFTLRKAYGLPTADHQDAFYAYLFYRVLQRAENIYLFYNTETDVLGQGEMSRFLQQIRVESGWNPSHEVLHNPIQPHPIHDIEIRKDDTVLQNLTRLNEGNARFKGISPSALNTYIECQLQFYFKHVAKIKEAREVEDDLDARLLGNLLHEVMERFYKKIQDRKKTNLIEAEDLKDHEVITNQIIDAVFIDNYSLDPSRKVIYEGQRLVVREVMKSFVKSILTHDKTYAPFSIEGLEHAGLLYYTPISHAPGQAVIGGKIDRIDRKGNLIRVIDYKTGSDKLDFVSVESLFSRVENRNKAAFQTLLYALLYKSNYPEPGLAIVPGLINRLNIFEDEFSFGLKVNKELLSDATPLFPELEARLKLLLEEMFNPEETFRQTTNTETCRFCPYKGICYR